MRKRLFLPLLLTVLLSLTACSAGRDIGATYPRVEYRNSSYNFDPYNRENGYPMMWWKSPLTYWTERSCRGLRVGK